MKLKKLIYIVPAAMIMSAVSGCSDSDDWTPGPQDTETGVSAYFPVPAKTTYIFGSDDLNKSIEVSVSRQNTAEAASVPVSISNGAEGFSIPQSVEFAAGEATSSFLLDCSGIEEGKSMNVTVSLDPKQTDIYGEGLSDITFSVIKANWKETSGSVRYRFYDSSVSTQLYPSVYGKLYQLEGTYMFKLTDFCGSGLDITFNCDAPGDMVLTPLVNADFDSVTNEEDKELNAWYLYDEAGQDWPSFNPGGLDGYTPIQYLMLYSDASYNSFNMLDDPASLYAFGYFMTGITFADDSFTWSYIYVDATLDYNPYSQD